MPAPAPKPTLEPKGTTTSLSGVVLAVFATLFATLAISFAAHHMRIGYEQECQSIQKMKVDHAAYMTSQMIIGDDFVNDPNAAAQKYAAVLSAMLVDADTKDRSELVFSLYVFGTDGQLHSLVQSPNALQFAQSIEIAELNFSEKDVIRDEGDLTYTVLRPLRDSGGYLIGFYELGGSLEHLSTLGDTIESKVFIAGMLCVILGLILYAMQYFIPFVIAYLTMKGGSK